jgi:SPX domain protein involved in polyphosphate accumulation
MQLSSKSIRKEIKYKVFLKDIGHLYSWLYSSSGFRRSYKDRGVNSLYFDTPTYDFASSNMSGESKRIKVRARWYSEIDDGFMDSYISPAKTFNFEVKRKENSLSDKLLIGKLETGSGDDYAKRSMLLTKKT